MVKRRSLGLVAVIACAACTQSSWDLGTLGPTPTPSGSPSGTTPVATPTDFFGDGRDGAHSSSGNTKDYPNDCRRLVLGNEGGLTLSSALTLAPGDRVLAIQMQSGSTMSVASPGAVDDIVAGGAGNWDLVTVLTAGGAGVGQQLITPQDPLTHVYRSDSTHAAQACRVPQYASMTLSQGVIAGSHPWNGETGGVVAILVNGTLSIDEQSAIDVSGQGYRGGPGGQGFGSQSITDLDTSFLDGAAKGDSTDMTAFTLFGRGARSNGAGGGNSVSAGGGGGGNGGTGGYGGKQSDLFPAAGNNNRGTGGGSAAAALDTMLLMGGGGGAGQSGGTKIAGTGGRGGGIVFVRAFSVSTARIYAKGAAGTNGLDDNGGPGNGGGGGGAGGSVMLWLGGGGGGITIDASGGKGGNALTQLYNCGPGGGGGGGRVAVSGATAAGSVPAVLGGAAGTATKSQTAFGATPGGAGSH